MPALQPHWATAYETSGVCTSPGRSATRMPRRSSTSAASSPNFSELRVPEARWSQPMATPLSARSAAPKTFSRYSARPCVVCTTTSSFIAAYPAAIGPRSPAVPNSRREPSAFSSPAESPRSSMPWTTARVSAFVSHSQYCFAFASMSSGRRWCVVALQTDTLRAVSAPAAQDSASSVTMVVRSAIEETHPPCSWRNRRLRAGKSSS